MRHFIFCIFCVLTLFSDSLMAQIAPPPVRRASPEELSQLAAERDFRARTRLAVELATARLTAAEQATDADDFRRASSNIGAYLALLDEAFAVVTDDNLANGKARGNARALEKTLRAHVNRLEALRRRTSTAYAPHVEAAAEHARRLRTEALNRVFGENVFEQPPNRTADTTPPT